MAAPVEGKRFHASTDAQADHARQIRRPIRHILLIGPYTIRGGELAVWYLGSHRASQRYTQVREPVKMHCYTTSSATLMSSRIRRRASGQHQREPGGVQRALARSTRGQDHHTAAGTSPALVLLSAYHPNLYGNSRLVQLLQGDEDRVVPKSQSDMIYESIKRRGGVVEYQVYPGEGHGFRKAEHVKDATERELAFYRRILNIGADDAE